MARVLGIRNASPSKNCKTKVNASVVAVVLLTLVCFSECFSWTALTLRNGGNIDNNVYHGMLKGIIVLMQSVVQCSSP